MNLLQNADLTEKVEYYKYENLLSHTKTKEKLKKK